MRILKINLDYIQDKEIDLIVDHFRQGAIVVHPTDTVYGLGCRAADGRAVKRIFKIKQRSADKPVLILVASFDMLREHCYFSAAQERYLKRIWPGPITAVLKSRENLPAGTVGEDGSLAARLPKNDFLITILKRLGEPIVSTSLNISGQKDLVNLKQIDSYFKKDKPDLVVDAGPMLKGGPSRVIDIRNINNIKILRQ